MRSRIAQALSLLLALPSLSALAAAAPHGGQFRGPGFPAGPVKAPLTGTPARPTTNPVTPVPGSITGRGGVLQPNRGRTRSTALAPNATIDRWENWWRHNREPYLPRHSAGAQPTSGVGGFFTGRSSVPAARPGAFEPGEVRSRILPVLAGVLGDKSADVVDSAVIALARATRAGESGPFLVRFARALVHEHRSVREAALLGLGILGSDEAAEMLRSIVRDDRTGRELVGEVISIDDRHRSLAALALGLIDQPANVPVLLDVLRSPGSTRQLASCAVLSLGMHHSRAHEVVVELAIMLESPRLDREIRAQVPVALMRLPRGIARSQLSLMVELLKDRDTPAVLRRSLAIALGNLGSPEDSTVRELLGRLVKKDADVMVRNYSCIALGRMAERSTWSADVAKEIHSYLDEASSTLVREMSLGKNQRVQPFAAIALGLLLRAEAFEADEDTRGLGRRIRSKLRENFLGERDPSLQGAGAIAIGLARDAEQAPAIRGRLGSSKNPTSMGYLAEALGMLGDAEAAPLLRSLLEKPGRPQELQTSIARALGLLGDPALQPLLIRMLDEVRSVPEAAAIANGLGLSGDRAAAGPLLEIAPDTRKQNLPRAFSIVALGLLAEKTSLPWNTIYSVDANYTLLNDALQEVLSIL